MAHRVAREHPLASQLHATILTNYHRKIPILSEDSMFNKLLDNPTPYLKNSERFLLTEQVVVQPNKKFAIMPIAVYQRVKDGNPLHGTDRWLSFGARPQFFF